MALMRGMEPMEAGMPLTAGFFAGAAAGSFFAGAGAGAPLAELTRTAWNVWHGGAGRGQIAAAGCRGAP